MYIAGVNGCRSGWLVVSKDLDAGSEHLLVAPTFADALNLPGDPAIICIDIPIGLLDAAEPGGRECDRIARQLLGTKASSVFPPPVRPAFRQNNYPAANRANRRTSEANLGISKQAFMLLPKLREVDALMTPTLQKRVREIHPELCFFEMNSGVPVKEPKRKLAGQKPRVQLLKEAGFKQVDQRIKSAANPYVALDDILDAYAACWTAERIYTGAAICIPENPPVDSRGLRMEMWR